MTIIDSFERGHKTGPAAAGGEPGAVIRRARDGVEMVNLAWGLAPGRASGKPYTVIRCEGRAFPSHRCLIPASEFRLSTGKGKVQRKWRFTLASGDFFYLAGIWRPRGSDWPAAYAVLTIAANLDVALYHDRQMAVILRADRMAWLDLTRPEEELLKPLPARSFRAELEEGPPALTSAFDWGLG